MKSKSKLKIGIITLGIVFACLSINNYYIFNDQRENDETIKFRDESNLKRPKSSGYWTTNFIHIDGNWSETEATYDWCSGDGSWGNPYTIENVTIDVIGSPTGSGILINNSKNDYFIISNCTIYNGGSGIMLENTDKGTLTKNDCSNNNYGLWLYGNCENNTISGNTANENANYGIYLRDYCDNNTISGNIASNNGGTGIPLWSNCDNNTISGNIVCNNVGVGVLLRDNCDDNTISGNDANNSNYYGIYLYENCDDNTISGNNANDNGYYGIYLREYCDNNTISGNNANNNERLGTGIMFLVDCDNNTISGNTVNNNSFWGIYLDADCDNNTISENYIYFNIDVAIVINSANCDYNIIDRNVLVSNDWKFINDGGTNTTVRMNYFSNIFPSFVVEVIAQSFSTTEFIVTIKVFCEITSFEVSDLSIQMWWNGIIVSSSNIAELVNGSYNISISPIFVNPGEDPILLNMTISAVYHRDKYFETYIAVEPPEIDKLLQVEIVEHSYSLERFNLTIFVCDEAEQGIDSAAVQMWWNGVDVSVDVINLGNGFYFVSLEPITVAPGEDPILLNMIISADGYEDKHFETYLAVDPDTLDKGITTQEFPLTIVIIAITSIAGGIGVAGVSLVLLRKRRRASEIK